MRKNAIFLLLVLVFACSKDDGPKIPEGDRVISAAILGWRDIGTICPAPKDVNGLADLEVTFNGGVPSNGNLTLQSKWKLPSETEWTYEEKRSLDISTLSKNETKVNVANGYCWGLADSVVSCEFRYVGPNGDESEIITIPIPRPQ